LRSCERVDYKAELLLLRIEEMVRNFLVMTKKCTLLGDMSKVGLLLF
jgi:hypothetical protein